MVQHLSSSASRDTGGRCIVEDTNGRADDDADPADDEASRERL